MKLAFNVYKLFITNSKSLPFIDKKRKELTSRFESKESHIVPQDNVKVRSDFYCYNDGYNFSWRFREHGLLGLLSSHSSKFEFKKEKNNEVSN